MGEKVRPSQLLPLIFGLMAVILVVRSGWRRFAEEPGPVAGACASAAAGAGQLLAYPSAATADFPGGQEEPEAPSTPDPYGNPQDLPRVPQDLPRAPTHSPAGFGLADVRGPASGGTAPSPEGVLALHRAHLCILSPVVRDGRALRPRPPPGDRSPATRPRPQQNPSAPRPPPAAA